MNKDKISIALTKTLIKKIDTECEKTGLSRSSFIELIIRQHYTASKKNQIYWKTNVKLYNFYMCKKLKCV